MPRPIALTPAYLHVNYRLRECLDRLKIPHMVIHQCSDLVKVRSFLLSNALSQTDADLFLLIDADMVPSPEHVEMLVESPKLLPDSAVTGAYLTRGEVLAAQPTSKTPFNLGGSPRFVECWGSGLGFSAITRQSVETVAERLPVITESNGLKWHPFCLPRMVSHPEFTGGKQEYLSEDYAFWWNCREHGVGLWLDTHLVIPHMVERPLVPDEEMNVDPG